MTAKREKRETRMEYLCRTVCDEAKDRELSLDQILERAKKSKHSAFFQLNPEGEFKEVREDVKLSSKLGQ